MVIAGFLTSEGSLEESRLRVAIYYGNCFLLCMHTMHPFWFLDGITSNTNASSLCE